MNWIRRITEVFGILAIILLIIYAFTIVYFSYRYPQTKWNWQQVDTKRTNFPKDFLWGTATSAFQVEGNNTSSNWSDWEKGTYANGIPHIKNGDLSGNAADQWNLYAEDIELMKKLGLNSYRFSISWSKIQPTLDGFDENALKHYDDLIDSLIGADIMPMITLHHFTHPKWFEEIGGFENRENLKYFERFVNVVFRRYGNRVRMWCTFNEPNVYVISGYFNANFPPGKHAPALAGLVFENILRAHTEVYNSMKQIDKELFHSKPPLKIGIVQSIFQFEPYRRWHLGDWFIARTSANVFNGTTLGFFRDGKMKYWLPGIEERAFIDSNAPNTIDFIGLNYYSHYAYKFNLDFVESTKSLPVEGEEMTDMPYSIYTEGIYRAIEEVAKLGKPVIITENGIADADDTRREKYIRQSLYAVSKAIEDGYDVRGYYYWSLIDNFEWAEGYSMKFGLYRVDLSTQERTLRNGARAFEEIVNRPTH